MKITETHTVDAIKPFECKDWLLGKHYAKRIPSISWAFGLFKHNELIGVCTFGKPASPSLCVGVLGKEYFAQVYELNRLVLQSDQPNALSYFVGKALSQLPSGLCVVSYADTALGHHGYIYQATNWIYTGCSAKRTDPKGEEGQHGRHIKCDGVKERVTRSSKHRYVYFTGSKTEKKRMRKALRYPVLPYPKGDNQKYDASYKPVTQGRLF